MKKVVVFKIYSTFIFYSVLKLMRKVNVVSYEATGQKTATHQKYI